MLTHKRQFSRETGKDSLRGLFLLKSGAQILMILHEA